MTDIDPDKLLRLRGVWLEAQKASQEAFEAATKANMAASDAESDLMAYVRSGDAGLEEERKLRDQVKAFRADSVQNYQQYAGTLGGAAIGRRIT